MGGGESDWAVSTAAVSCGAIRSIDSASATRSRQIQQIRREQDKKKFKAAGGQGEREYIISY